MPMNARSIFLFPLIATLGLAAQNTVTPSSYTFSDGIHPTFSFLFEGTDTKYVESYWKDELKKISGSISTKKELTASAALIPSISSDTVRVLVKAEQRKGAALTMAHVAILTSEGYLGPNSNDKAFEAGKAFVQQHSTLIRHQLATQELTLAERGLTKLQGELQNLQHEKERAEAGIEKSKQRAAEAALEQEGLRTEVGSYGPKISTLRSDPGTSADEAKTKELADLEKQQKKAQDKLRKAEETERSMTKKSDDLTWAIKKNVEEQARKSEAVAQQETLVTSLREKLSTIH